MSRIIQFTILALIIFISFSFSTYGAESEWEKFKQMKDQYYYLDKQQFNEISCVIDVPLMAIFIGQIKKQFGPLEKNVEIKENMSGFVLTYSRISGLKFSNPEFDIILKSKEGLADPEKVENGISNIITGFEEQVDGVKQTIGGLFHNYSYAKQENYKDMVFTKNEEAIIVKYSRGNYKYTETYSGNTINTSVEGDNINIISTQNYVPSISDKLILSKDSSAINVPTLNMKTDISIEYNKIGNIVFPKNIKTIYEQSMQSISHKGTLDIVLINCQIKDGK